MDDKLFRLLMDLTMVSDPWPLDEGGHKILIDALDKESKLRNFDNWIVAYHEFKPGD